jgi:hypothetical protein
VRTGSRCQGGNWLCEWVVATEVGGGFVVMRTVKYSEMECSCRTGRQVLRGGGTLSYGPSSTRTVGRMPLFDMIGEWWALVRPSSGSYVFSHLCL